MLCYASRFTKKNSLEGLSEYEDQLLKKDYDQTKKELLTGDKIRRSKEVFFPQYFSYFSTQSYVVGYSKESSL